MKAITLKSYGTADDLELTDHPEPKVAPGEVLVRVKAAGVNPVDWKLGAGMLDDFVESRFPRSPDGTWPGSSSGSGSTCPSSPSATRSTVHPQGLGAARRLRREGVGPRADAGPQARLALLGAGRGLPLAGLTAYQALDRVGVREGWTVLIHAAAGGVGSLGAQIAVARGARVIGTASESNHAFLRGLGVEPVTYGEGLADRVRALAPDGVDAALDFVGGEALEVSLELLGDPGRLASIVDPQVTGHGGHYVWVRPDSAGLAALGRLADEGRLTVPVAEVLPLADAARAWRLSSEGRTRGKLVLAVEQH